MKFMKIKSNMFNICKKTMTVYDYKYIKHYFVFYHLLLVFWDEYELYELSSISNKIVLLFFE